jgi:hypothetical protein
MFRVHTVWITGPHAGKRRTWDTLEVAVATKTMNMLLAGGVCAWIEEIRG